MRWEHKITADSTQPDLCELGEDGWELVGVSTVTIGEETPSQLSNFAPLTVYRTVRWTYLKRPIDQEGPTPGQLAMVNCAHEMTAAGYCRKCGR